MKEITSFSTPPEAINQAINRETAVRVFLALKNDLSIGRVTQVDFMSGAMGVAGFFASGLDVDAASISRAREEFLRSGGTTEAYQAGLEGNNFTPLPYRRSPGWPDQGVREFWQNLVGSLIAPQQLATMGGYFFPSKESTAIITGAYFALIKNPEIFRSGIPTVLIGLSSLHALRTRMTETIDKAISQRIKADVRSRDLSVFYTNCFPPELFYLTGLAERMNNQLSIFGQAKWGDDYGRVRNMLAALVFAQTKDIRPSARITGFGRFKSTDEVLRALARDDIIDAGVRMETVIAEYPWYFRPHDVSLFSSGRINMSELIARRNAQMTEVPPIDDSVKTNKIESIRQFQEKVGWYPIAGLIGEWKGITEEGKQNHVYLLITTEIPRQTRRRTTSELAVNQNLPVVWCITVRDKESGWEAKEGGYLLDDFCRLYLAIGDWKILGTRRKITSGGNTLSLPRRVLELMEKTIYQSV